MSIPETKRQIHLSYLATQLLILTVNSATVTTEAVAGKTISKTNHVDRLRLSMLSDQTGYSDVSKWETCCTDAQNDLVMAAKLMEESSDNSVFEQVQAARKIIKELNEKGAEKHDRVVDISLIAWVQLQVAKSNIVLPNGVLSIYGEMCTAFGITMPESDG